MGASSADCPDGHSSLSVFPLGTLAGSQGRARHFVPGFPRAISPTPATAKTNNTATKGSAKKRNTATRHSMITGQKCLSRKPPSDKPPLRWTRGAKSDLVYSIQGNNQRVYLEASSSPSKGRKGETSSAGPEPDDGITIRLVSADEYHPRRVLHVPRYLILTSIPSYALTRGRT